MVVLALNHDVVTTGLKSRIIKRSGLPSSAEAAPPNFFKLFVFAHEMGHIIQADLKFKEVFGEIDDTIYLSINQKKAMKDTLKVTMKPMRIT